jgi:hypothetical protein
MKLALLSVAVVLAGCSTTFGGPDRDVTISVPAITIEAGPGDSGRVYLRRHYVERGVRYCEYSNGRTYQRHWRYDCPRYHY